MLDVSFVQAAAAGGAALVTGLVGGILIGRRRPGGGDADWKMRMAARDHDLADAVARLSDAEIELQALRIQVSSVPPPDVQIEARLAELTEELNQADEELTRLRFLGVDKEPAGSSAMARRLESLEVELSTLASMRCPDPSAHRTVPRRRDPAAHSVPPAGDDLTLITGVGPGLAELLRSMGYRTFDDIASLGDDDLDRIGEVAGGIVGPSAREGWVESARRLAEEDPD